MGDSAEIIIGHVFEREDLVSSSKLKILTIKSLDDFLRRNTEHLALEWYGDGVINGGYTQMEEINFRSGYHIGRGRRIKSNMNENKYRFLVGSCIAELDNHPSILEVGSITQMDGNLVRTLVEEFQKSFPNREWKDDDMKEVLVNPSYPRDIGNRRLDYPINILRIRP